jgi:hypothetical protein
MKRLVIIGLAVPAIVAVGFGLVFLGMAGWEAYYWRAAPDLARDFRTAAAGPVRSDSVDGLEGVTVEEAWARAEEAEFGCLPSRDALHCARFLADFVCSEDWTLVLETAEGHVSKVTATKHLVACKEGMDETAGQ